MDVLETMPQFMDMLNEQVKNAVSKIKMLREIQRSIEREQEQQKNEHGSAEE